MYTELLNWISFMLLCYHFNYGTDLMQRRTRAQVLGHHSRDARTRLSVSFNGLELAFERKLERAGPQSRTDNKGALLLYYTRPPIGT